MKNYFIFSVMDLSFNQRLKAICREKNNYLCIGLDLDFDIFSNNSIVDLNTMEIFGKEIIDGTIEFCPIYKPNFAFFERYGSKGYAVLENLVNYINGRSVIIADAKRGDIGNTSKQYAYSILESMGCDAITVSPYMGRDSIEPFINNPLKGVFVLAVTSNSGAREIQEHGDKTNPLYHKVIQISKELNINDNIGLVIGATQIDIMTKIREISLGMPWLIPGVGSQGGDMGSALTISHTNGGIGIINVSRGILSSGNGEIYSIINAAKKYTKQIRETICKQIES